MSTLTLQKLYDRLLLKETVTIEGIDEREYTNLRTSVLRKYRMSQKIFDKFGMDSPLGMEYIQCSYSKATEKEASRAVFRLANRNDRKTRPKEYSVKDF